MRRLDHPRPRRDPRRAWLRLGWLGVAALLLAGCAGRPRAFSQGDAAVLLDPPHADAYRARLAEEPDAPRRAPPNRDGLLTDVVELYDPLTGAQAVVDGSVRPLPGGGFVVEGPVPYQVDVRDGMVWIGVPEGERVPFFDAWGDVRMMPPARVVRPTSPFTDDDMGPGPPVVTQDRWQHRGIGESP